MNEIRSAEGIANLRVIYNCNRCGRRLKSHACAPNEDTRSPKGCPKCDDGPPNPSPYEVERERRMTLMRQRSAQCWCDEDTKDIEMDSRLAEAFARRLLIECYQPNLGCATTADLLHELYARLEVSGSLDYSTVQPLDTFSVVRPDGLDPVTAEVEPA